MKIVVAIPRIVINSDKVVFISGRVKAAARQDK
jgi:hypothetical protein